MSGVSTVDWFRPDWGNRVHVATSGNYGTDPGHDDDSNGDV